MKALVFAIFAVAALAFAPVSIAEVSNLDSYQEFLPASSGSSSEAEVVQPALHDYTVGLSGPNFCMTKTIKAESESQAMDQARQSCAKCRIENLTGKMEFGEAPWEITPKSETFCQLELK
jgi:hypothetical protein